MRKALPIIVVALLTGPAGALGAERRPHIEQDDCAKAGATCEKGCDAKAGMVRLSCKTDCRLVETECRNRKR